MEKYDELIDALSGYVEVSKAGTIRHYNKHGKLHRIGGPAVIFADGTRRWFLDGCTKTEEEFNSCIAKGDYLEP